MAIIESTSAGIGSSLIVAFTATVTRVVKMLLVIQYTPRPAGTFKLKNATMNGRLLTKPCRQQSNKQGDELKNKCKR